MHMLESSYTLVRPFLLLWRATMNAARHPVMAHPRTNPTGSMALPTQKLPVRAQRTPSLNSRRSDSAFQDDDEEGRSVELRVVGSNICAACSQMQLRLSKVGGAKHSEGESGSAGCICPLLLIAVTMMVFSSMRKVFALRPPSIPQALRLGCK